MHTPKKTRVNIDNHWADNLGADMNALHSICPLEKITISFTHKDKHVEDRTEIYESLAIVHWQDVCLASYVESEQTSVRSISRRSSCGRYCGTTLKPTYAK